MGPLWRSCVEMHAVIELLLGEVSGVDLGIHALDGSACASRGRVDFEVVCLHWPSGFNGVFFN